jgi:hypothetical protein
MKTIKEKEEGVAGEGGADVVASDESKDPEEAAKEVERRETLKKLEQLKYLRKEQKNMGKHDMNYDEIELMLMGGKKAEDESSSSDEGTSLLHL